MNLSPLKPLVYDAQKYNALMDYVQTRITLESKRLEDLVEPQQIYLSQGRIKAYRSLLSLREEVINSEDQHGR